MYRIHMVEDEDAAAGNLRALLLRYASERGLDFSISRDSSALPFMERKASYDLVFLDIQMPGINGMEAAEALRQHDQTTPIVFVTNLAQYAVKGYEVNALDFVVKPVTYGSLAMCMDRALRMADRNRTANIVIQSREGAHILPLDELVCVEVRDHDLVYRMMDGTEVHTRGSLSKVAKELTGRPLVKISQSCIANMALIRLVRQDGLVMADGSTLWFSRAGKKPAMERITDYLSGSI